MVGEPMERANKRVGGYQADAKTVLEMVRLNNDDNLLPGVERSVVVRGNVMETLPQFIQEHPGLRISLLHFDLDLYESTKFALRQLYPLVVKGGVVVFDEYGLPPWEGETRVVEEYFEETIGRMPIIRKNPLCHSPHGYFIK